MIVFNIMCAYGTGHLFSLKKGDELGWARQMSLFLEMLIFLFIMQERHTSYRSLEGMEIMSLAVTFFLPTLINDRSLEYYLSHILVI